jgi:hypothetical protein
MKVLTKLIVITLMPLSMAMAQTQILFHADLLAGTVPYRFDRPPHVDVVRQGALFRESGRGRLFFPAFN